MRHTRSHTANRRSHHALKGTRLSTCAKCSASHVRHQVCTNCGTYRGKEIRSVAKALTKGTKRVASKGKKAK